MTLIAASGAAVFVYLGVGLACGVQLRRLPRRRRSPGLRPRLLAWLEQGDTAVGVGAFASVIAGSALATSCLTVAVTDVPVLGVIAAGAGALAPVAIVEQRRSASARARRAAWPDALRDVAVRLRAGSSLHGALVDLGRLGPAPLRASFVRYEQLANALDQRVALETIRNELAEPLSDRVVDVLLVAFDQGGRVVIDVLDDLADSAVADLHLMADIETAQLETTLEARGAATLPFVVLALLCLGSSGYRSFYAGGVGTAVVLLGLAMSLVGLAVITRLGRIADEPRRMHGSYGS